MRINGINVEIPKIELDKKQQSTPSLSPDKNFSSVISEAINDVNTAQVEADHAIENMLTGKSRNVHETMISMEKADITLKLMASVRNKAMDAYNTVMRMQA